MELDCQPQGARVDKDATDHMREALKEMDEKLPPSGERDKIYREIRETMLQLTNKINKLAFRLGIGG